MIPAAFEYVAPATLDEAISLLQRHGDDAKILAGGHSLLPLMKLRLAAPALLIDLAHIPDLSYIRPIDGEIAIGAMTPYVELEGSSLLRERVPLLIQTAGLVGDAQVRNRGTLGGAMAHADPAGDMPSAVTALGGSIVARGPDGERTIVADEFFEDIFTSALAPDEIVTEVRIPAAGGRAQSYQKFRRRMIDWAIVGVAVNLSAADGIIDAARVVLTNVGARPARATTVEEALVGGEIGPDTVHRASELAADGIDPSAELYASSEYKKHLARVMTRRALSAALGVAERS